MGLLELLQALDSGLSRFLTGTGAGSISDIIAGIDYVTAHSDEIDVVNLSFGCECSSPALDVAINNAVQAGVVFVVGAGNDHKDASSFSPARNPNVIAVSAMADSDGKCGMLKERLQNMEVMTPLLHLVTME